MVCIVPNLATGNGCDAHTCAGRCCFIINKSRGYVRVQVESSLGMKLQDAGHLHDPQTTMCKKHMRWGENCSKSLRGLA